MTIVGTPRRRPAPSAMKATLATLLLALLAGIAANARAEAGTRVYQQRLADGRMVLSDRPIEGVAIQRTWEIAREDPEAARRRSEAVRLESEAVSERIARRLEREQADRQEAESLRGSLAEARREAERARDTGGTVLLGQPYGRFGEMRWSDARRSPNLMNPPRIGVRPDRPDMRRPPKKRRHIPGQD